jgi:hypothetical protein
MMRRSACVILLAIGFAMLLGASNANAFCRKTTCPSCDVNPLTTCIDEGELLAWPGACVSYALARAASRQVTLTEAKIVAARAFEAWQSVTCPGNGSPPSIVATDAFGITECSLHEYNRGAGNANIVAFRDDSWEHQDAEDALALTSMSFNERTGDILDADIEINAAVPITTSSDVPPSGYDLLSILTHEAGHFLGLAHSPLPTATMYPIYQQGTADWRTLSDDDIAGICAIYPPDRAALPCDFTPPGGFASECALAVTKGGCSMANRSSTPGAWYALSVIGLLLWNRRRQA